MDIKKDLLKQLPQWCKEVPFQIKGIAVKEACNTFWAAKGNPSFRRLKDPEQSCFIPKSAIKSEGSLLQNFRKGIEVPGTVSVRTDGFKIDLEIWKMVAGRTS